MERGWLGLVAALGVAGCQTASPKAATHEEPVSTPVTHANMVQIPAGNFPLGGGRVYPDEDPAHQAVTEGFWIDRKEVTNAQFAKFVEATEYVTTAERQPRVEDYPDADPAKLKAGSACFCAADSTQRLNDRWEYRLGADWRHPDGPATTADPALPVVHVTFEDAMAYAKWAGKDLPTADEWEIAARGGLVNAKYAWGNEFRPRGKWMANVYQGVFPTKDAGLDGKVGLAKGGGYPANGYGIYDMIGNVWELTKTPAPHDDAAGQDAMWAKGGSYLCADNYCARYRPAARIPVTVDTSTNHIGFRCVVRR